MEQTSYDCPVMTRASLLCNLESLSRMELDPSFILLNNISYEEVLEHCTYCLKYVEEQRI